MTLALIDWGVGGLDLWSRIRRCAPSVPLVYVSDSGCPPYGGLSVGALRARLRYLECICRGAGASHLVVACNTLSSVLDPRWGALPSVGVVQPTLSELESRPMGSLGVVATARTVASGVYRRPFPRAAVRQVALPKLGPLIESGAADERLVRSMIGGAMQPLEHVETLVLGCTHYLAYASEFLRHAPRARLVDPAECTLRTLRAHWLPVLRGKGGSRIFTTGCPERMRHAAGRAFGLELGPIERLDPDLLRSTPGSLEASP